MNDKIYVSYQRRVLQDALRKAGVKQDKEEELLKLMYDMFPSKEEFKEEAEKRAKLLMDDGEWGEVVDELLFEIGSVNASPDVKKMWQEAWEKECLTEAVKALKKEPDCVPKEKVRALIASGDAADKLMDTVNMDDYVKVLKEKIKDQIKGNDYAADSLC